MASGQPCGSPPADLRPLTPRPTSPRRERPANRGHSPGAIQAVALAPFVGLRRQPLPAILPVARVAEPQWSGWSLGLAPSSLTSRRVCTPRRRRGTESRSRTDVLSGVRSERMGFRSEFGNTPVPRVDQNRCFRVGGLQSARVPTRPTKQSKSTKPRTSRRIVARMRSTLEPTAEVSVGPSNLINGPPEDHPCTAEVKSPKAREVADLVGILEDLDIVLQLLDELRGMANPADGSVVAYALWTSALVTYARCFGTGKRLGLRESLFDSVDPGARAVHRYWIEMRNKHVAHSVNPFDHVSAGAVLSPPSHPNREVTGTAYLRHRHMGWGHDGVQSLSNVTQLVQKFADARFKEVDAAFFREVGALKIGGLYQLPPLRSVTPGPDEAMKPRPE